MPTSERIILKRSIEEQLMRVEYHGECLKRQRGELQNLEERIYTSVLNVNAAKRELYRLGWKG